MKQKKQQARPLSFFEACDSFLERHDRYWFWAIFGITLLISILLYDPRVSTGGDDSVYILSARDFVEDFRFPSFQGPLYPFFLSILYSVFDMSLTAFKISSVVFVMAFMLLLFLAFRRRIPATLLFIMLSLTACNSQVLYFASQTYSEAFYMFLQALVFFVFIRFFIDREQTGTVYLWLSLAVLGVILTRSVGYSLFLCVAGYFVVCRQWKNLLCFTAIFLLCFGVFQLTKYLLWEDMSLQAAGQGAGLLNKNFYNPSYGREDLAGFVNRFRINSLNYLSQFFIMLGLQERYPDAGVFVRSHTVWIMLVYGAGLAGVWFSRRQNRPLFFTGVVTAGFLAVTFLVLQTSWNQYRLIVPVFSFMVLILFYAGYSLLSLPGLRAYQFLLVIPFFILMGTTLADTRQAVEAAGKIKDRYSGFTPDWLHYLRASTWAADSLPGDALVACRKPSISSVYGRGKKFHGIFRIPAGNFDLFYERWKGAAPACPLIGVKNLGGADASSLKGFCQAYIQLGDQPFMMTSDTVAARIKAEYPGLEVIDSPDTLAPVIEAAGNRLSIYYADSLLAPLREAGVTHILMASLRSRENLKNGITISTVERYVAYIRLKYPGFIRPLRQFGQADDEPAIIALIDWDAVK